jgi:hypothetical protein
VPAPVVVLAVWTLLVWAGRIRNAVASDEGIGPVLLAGTFVVLAVLALATRGRSRTAGLALAVWTIAVWVVRGIDIALFSDHETAFVVVHLVLATVSVALAVWTARSLTRSARAPQPVAG